MKRRLFASMLTAACAVVPLASLPVAPAQAQTIMHPTGEVVLSIGRGQLVTLPSDMADIFIANDAIADVQLKSQRQLFVFGRSGGETTLYASNAFGDVIWATTIRVGSNIGSIDQMLAIAMPDAKVAVATMGSNTVLLTGTVAAPEDAAEAERLVRAFLGDGANVVSRLKTATPLQVNLRVRFAEVSRSLVRNLGANLTSLDRSGGNLFALGQGRGTNAVNLEGIANGNAEITFQQTPGMTMLGGYTKLLGLDIAGTLDLAERNGLLTTLAQPNLTALSGETAEFLAGGEFPIPVSQGLGSTSIEYRKFGVSLSYTPIVLSNGRISIRVRPEVSELSSQGAVTIGGFQIPALTIRRAETTVELGSGQSFMIAGLLSNNSQSSIDKAPGLGDVPVLGNLFKSTEFRKGQTELVIVVTPYLVKPVDDSQIKLPTDGFRAPNMFQQLLGNMESDGVDGAKRPMPTTSGEGAPPPKLSLSNQGMQQGLATSDDKNRHNDGKGKRSASAAATPGFSLK